MHHLLTEFRQFILRGNVVDLAVGIVIGVTLFGCRFRQLRTSRPVLARSLRAALLTALFRVVAASFG